MKNSLSRRLMAFFLTFILIVSIIPIHAMASPDSLTDTADFRLRVMHVNHPPTANNDSYLSLLEDIAVTLNVLANDVDYDLHDDVDELLIL
ncbi:MAG: hypothetical protein FWC09_05385, partial [Lachnospiraceae bacterium]|nr:hypothetical protein [Lachnospiraceae bacterium]